MSTKTSSPLQAVNNTLTSTTTASSSSSGSSPSTPLSSSAVASIAKSTNPHTQTAECTMNAIKIKSELPSDEIKEYAETTMKELLGWYGFDGLDRLDLSTKTARLLQAAAANDNCNSAGNSRGDHHQPATQPHHMERRNQRSRGISGAGRAATSLMQTPQQRDELMRKVNNPMVNNNNISSFSNNNNTNCNANCTSSMRKSNFSRNSRSAGGIGSTDGGATSDHDTRSSREDDSKSPQSTASKTGVVMEEKIDLLNCCWCRRPVPDNAPEFLTTCDGPRYCSESCFTQSRRASFKKAKTCDWCKHVRHAVSYVDFQDGASQLQFCSDKCLNQYKMQIFCKETQAHLDMNPHLRDQAMEAAAAGNGACLITPDLWMRNCRSRSASPASTVSVSPGPPLVSVPMPRKSPPSTAAASTCGTTASGGHLITSMAYSAPATPQSSYKPIISVAPASKLMSRSPSIMPSRTSPKHSRKKRQLRSSSNTSSSGVNELHNPKASSREMAALTGGSSGPAMQNKCGKSLLHVNTERTNHLRSSPGHMINNAAAGGGSAKSPASALSQFAGSSVQDLHMSVPPLSPMMDPQPPGAHASSQLPPMSLGGHGASIIPPSYFATTQGNGPSATSMHMPPAAMGHRPPPPPLFLPNAPPGMPPRFMGFPPSGTGLPPGHPPPPHFMQHPMMGGDFNAGLAGLFGGPQPPVTIMVPYPVIVPLPIPIPIPLPIKNFYKAYLSPEERLKFEEEERQKARAQETATAEQGNSSRTPTGETQEAEVSEEPLDFTKSRDETKVKSEKDSEALADKASEAEKSSEATTEDVEKVDDTATDSVVDCVAESVVVKETGDNDYSTEDARGKLPKLKITRLQTKRTLLIQTKESECSRPLRKRKRIIDCDFQKIALKEKPEAAEESGARESSDTYETAGEAPKLTPRDDDDDSADKNAEPPLPPVCNSNNNNNNIEDDTSNDRKIK